MSSLLQRAPEWPLLSENGRRRQGWWLTCVTTAAIASGSCAREPCQPLSSPGRSQRPAPGVNAEDVEPRPRCRPTDPGCGPQPLPGREVCYRPSSERERLLGRSTEPVPPNSRNACTHDGECNILGCGNVCASYRYGQMATICIGDASLDEAEFCGCVQGVCAFFKQ